jgi:hypothetical protein
MGQDIYHTETSQTRCALSPLNITERTHSTIFNFLQVMVKGIILTERHLQRGRSTENIDGKG